MKLLEKLLLVVIGLLAITALTVFFVAPQALIDLLQAIIAINLAVRLAIVLVIDVAILALIYTRLRSPRVTSDGLIVKSSGAVADISVDSARKLILAAVQKVPDVTAASADLTAVQGKADISLNVDVTGTHINVPQKQQEINRALKQVINKQLGLDIQGQPRVHINLHDDQLPPTPAKTTAPPVTVTPSPASVTETPKQEEKPVSTPAPAASQPDSKPADTAEKPLEDTDKTVTPAASDDWLKSFATNGQVENKKND